MAKPSAPPRQPSKRKPAAVKIQQTKRTATRGKPAAANIERQPAVRSFPPRLASVVVSSSGSNDYSLGPIDDDLRSTATSRFRFPAVSDASGDLSPRKPLPPLCICSLCNSDEDRSDQNSLRSTAAFPPPPADEQDPSYEEDPSEYEPSEEAAPPVEDAENLKPASWLPPPVSPIQASFTGDSWCYYDFDYYMC